MHDTQQLAKQLCEDGQMAAIQEYHHVTGCQLEAFPLISISFLCHVPCYPFCCHESLVSAGGWSVVGPGHQAGLRPLPGRGLGSPVLALVALHLDHSRSSGTGFDQIRLTRSTGKKESKKSSIQTQSQVLIAVLYLILLFSSLIL